MTSLTAMKLIIRINNMGFHETYRVADLMRYKSIRAMINGNRRIFWKFGEEEPGKPWLVFLYGIAPVANTLAMLEKWKQEYNIFVIEAIDAHYDILFDESSTFEDVVDTYALMVENNLPDGARLAGTAGFSWGGELAYRIAEYWARTRGEKPFVLCGDTYFINAVEEYRQEEITADSYPENLFELTGGAITQKEVVRKTNISIRMDNSVTVMPQYDGPVIMLNALSGIEPKKKKANLDLLKSLAPETEIIDFPNHAHNDLFYDGNLVPVYLDLMKKHTGEAGQ